VDSMVGMRIMIQGNNQVGRDIGTALLKRFPTILTSKQRRFNVVCRLKKLQIHLACV